MANRKREKVQHSGIAPSLTGLRVAADGKIDGNALNTIIGWANAITALLNGGLGLGDSWIPSAYSGNFNGHLIEWKSPAVAGAVDEIPHGLGRAPLGRIILGQSGYSRLADANLGGWGPDTIYLQSENADVTYKLWLV